MSAADFRGNHAIIAITKRRETGAFFVGDPSVMPHDRKRHAPSS